MVIAQVLLATPIITALSSAAIAAKEKLAMDTARTLGASERQAAWMVIKEARTGILAGIMTGFGRAFGEVGAVMLVGQCALPDQGTDHLYCSRDAAGQL